MPEENTGTVLERLARVQAEHDALKDSVMELKHEYNEDMAEIKVMLSEIREQTAKWKNVGVGISIAVGLLLTAGTGVYQIIKFLFGDINLKI